MNHDKRPAAAEVLTEPAGSDDASPEPALNRAVQDRIGNQLRALYDDLMHQPVPDRFVELLGRLGGRKEKASQ